MSNYDKPERPEGAPLQFYPEAEVVNGTGWGRITVHDGRCKDAGGDQECCTADLSCNFIGLPWQEMEALAWWILKEANTARWARLQETAWS